MFFAILQWALLFLSGLLLGLFVVLLLKVKTTKNKIRNQLKRKKKLCLYNQKEIDRIVKSQRRIYKKKNRWHVFKTVVGLNTKTKGYFSMYRDIINEVSKLQNPNSQKPFLEFSIAQAFEFIDSVTLDVEEIINVLDMPMLKNMDIDTVFGIVDFKKKLEEIKIVKSAKRIIKPLKPFIALYKICNPIKWVKMLVTAIFTASLTRDLIFAVADIVAWEFTQFYAQCKVEKVEVVA